LKSRSQESGVRSQEFRSSGVHEEEERRKKKEERRIVFTNDQ